MRDCVQGSSAFAIRLPSSSTQVDDQVHAACGGADPSSPLPSYCAPPSRQRSLVDDQSHLGATLRSPCDDGDRSSPSACCLRHFPATTGSRNSLPAERGSGLRSRGFVVSASSPPAGAKYTNTRGGGSEGRDHARPMGGDASAADEDVPGAEEDRRRAV